MNPQFNFIVIIKANEKTPELKIKSLVQKIGLKETTLGNRFLKVLTFQGSYIDLLSKKNKLESFPNNKYFTLIDIGLSPEFEIETIAQPDLFIPRSSHFSLNRHIQEIENL